MDVLLFDNPHRPRKCGDFNIKPIYQLNMQTKFSSALGLFLQELRNRNEFLMANPVKYFKKLVSEDMKNRIHEGIKECLTTGDKRAREKYINQIKVNICHAKDGDVRCPFCFRICGEEGPHSHHRCVYGHAMRGYTGSYFLNESKIKEASVLRCNEVKDSDVIDYQGKHKTWR